MTELLEVCWWPARLAPRSDGLYVIGVRGDGHRDTARRAIRQALTEALAGLYGLAAGDIMIQISPGVPPAVSFPVGWALEPTALGHAAAAPPGISITHEGPLSLAAIHLHGPVGIDIAQVQDIPDWRALARDYLGPRGLAALDSTPAPQRPRALAQAWAGHEASLKAAGRQLSEWDDELQVGYCHPLSVPEGYAGAVAIPARPSYEPNISRQQ
jgi:4'-phosphopantetheinyl transferase